MKHFAAKEANVSAQIRRRIYAMHREGVMPKQITIAPELEDEILRELALLVHSTRQKPIRIKTLAGIPVVVDEARAPRGVIVE